jgi:MSHA biogenesis protein MshO
MVRATPGLDARPPSGFTLVELVVVIVITGVMASVVGMFITGPIQGYLDQARRAELVDAAQLALLRMGRDLRAALPNSVRVAGGGTAVELLLTLDGDRYRAEPPGTAADRLDVAVPDDSFNTFAPLFPPAAGLPPLGTPYQVTGALAVYPLLQAGANPYVPGDGSMSPFGNIDITPVETPAGSGRTEYQVSLVSAPISPPGAHRFPFESPTRRVFLVQGPVSYVCDTSAVPGRLLRYDGYALADPPVVPPSPASVTLIAKNVESCAFQYAAGTAQRNAVVSIGVVFAEGGERVRLLRQVHVDNTP